MADPVEPPPSSGLFSTEVEGYHYVWRGKGPGERSTTISVFDLLTEQWSLKPTTGPPPPGLWSGASVCAGGYMYTFGGWDGSSYNNDMYKLDLDGHQWTKVSPSDNQPIRKMRFGFVGIDDGRLCCFGGFGEGPTQPGSTFSRALGDCGYTNEFHIFDVQNGVWSSPDVKGERPPPCSHFTLTKVDQHRAVLFGGQRNDFVKVNDVYLFNFKTMEFTKMEPVPGEPWPVRRAGHAACCLNHDEDHPQLLVSGGLGKDKKTLRDMWILDIDAGKWTEVTDFKAFQPRHYHSTTTTGLGPGLAEVFVFGGCQEQDGASMTDTTILRFEWTGPSQSVAGPSTGKWALVDVAHNNTRGSSQRLREKMVKIRKATSSVRDQVRDLEQQLGATQHLLQEKNHQLVVNSAEQQPVGAERRVQELTGDLERMTRRAQLAEERAEGLETQWVVQCSEIRMTQRQLGGGGWGVVKVAMFRGIKVAAKMLYEQIHSDYYRYLFIREMNMAARLRHPNLVQFIGATLDGEMIILTELMHTSLRRVLEGGAMSRKTIVSVSAQVCQALNYLHLMQPDPVIHRDISSANILLNPLPHNCWRAKVTDYGSVNTLRALQTENPGNPVYAAPEARIPSHQSPKMDIFSLGVLLIEMCTGQFPSDDRREHLLLTIQDRQFSDIITCCIDRESDNRPTASELIKEFQ